jgi:hypothetical protein
MIRPNSQTGIALIQVLLISLIISLLAIQFSVTAGDQVEMAQSFQNRVNSQIEAHSVFSEIIFSQLSAMISTEVAADISLVQKIQNKQNRFGEYVRWNENVILRVQDLNGLLPQLYPSHALWRVVLEKYGLDDKSIESYLGVWQDFQDPDVKSWRLGAVEPDFLPSGQRYLDGYAQTDHVLRWVFSDDPQLTDFLLSISDVHAPFDTSILNAPQTLLDNLFEPDVSNLIQRSRNVDPRKLPVINELIPAAMKRENIYIHNSPYQKIDVLINSNGREWQQSWVVLLDLDQAPHFLMIRN